MSTLEMTFRTLLWGRKGRTTATVHNSEPSPHKHNAVRKINVALFNCWTRMRDAVAHHAYQKHCVYPMLQLTGFSSYDFCYTNNETVSVQMAFKMKGAEFNLS